jgi:nucleoside-diphosphate-sugar epimerase
MTIFLTGATGVLGKRVARLLIENSYRVVALSRSESNSAQLQEMGAEPVRADLFSHRDIVAASKGCDAIFHLATHIPKVAIPNKPEHWAENDLIRTAGTRNLLEAAKAHGITQFVQPSVTILYGNQNGDYVTSESAVDRCPIQMVKSAATMEQLIRAEKGIDHIILRFGTFYASDAYNTCNLIEQMKKTRMPIIGKGDNFMNMIHADDAARAVVYAFQNFGRLKNRTLNFTDFSPIAARDFVRGMVHLVGGRKPLPIPAFLAKLVVDKNLYRYLTDSYRIRKEGIIDDWQPQYKDYWKGIMEIQGSEKG